MSDVEMVEAIKAFIDQRYREKLNKNSSQMDENPCDGEINSQKKLEELHRPEIWLSDAAKRARQISVVTHAPKFTHSDTQSMGVYWIASENVSTDHLYIHSGTVSDLRIDVMGNAAALDVARFLQLKVRETTLLDEIMGGNSPALKTLAVDEALYRGWMDGFSMALRPRELRSGCLAKQIFFPLETGYHLLAPLYATSLSQLLHEKIGEALYSEEAKAAREAKKKKKWSSHALRIYRNLAIQTFGGTKPQNISQLNSVRRGKGFLLSCKPPSWNMRFHLPKKGKHGFWKEYERRGAWKLAKKLQKYLESIFDKSSTKERRDQRAEFVDELIDHLIQLAAEIREQRQETGWTMTSELPRCEQLWLDPHRAETEPLFKQELEAGDWREGIADRFAEWLNKTISDGEKFKCGEPEFHEWSRLVERKLERLKDDLEFMR